MNGSGLFCGLLAFFGLGLAFNCFRSQMSGEARQLKEPGVAIGNVVGIAIGAVVGLAGLVGLIYGLDGYLNLK